MVRQENECNPFTKQPHSSQYKELLEARKKLPVFQQMNELMKTVCYGFVSMNKLCHIADFINFQLAANQVFVVAAETGSGKTTQ